MTLVMDHIHIRCTDLDKALNFYTDILGGELSGKGEVKGMPIVRVSLGGITLALSPPKEGLEVEPLSGKPGYGAYQLGFTIRDMEQTYQNLKAKGVRFKVEPMMIRDGLKVAFLAAPDGVEIELMEYC